MSKRKLYTIYMVICTLFMVSFFTRLPYYLNLPGDAYELAPIVKVEGGDEAIGEFMMTTVGVSRGKVNLLTYLWAQIAPYHDLVPAEKMRPAGVTDKVYHYRQLYMMDASQNTAIAVAYEKANKPITYKYNGVFVMSIIDGMDAVNKLEVGDRIFQVEGNLLESSEQFIEYIEDKQAGDTVDLQIERDGKVLAQEVKLTPFSNDSTKHGVGISLVTDREIKVEPMVNIESASVGGPSAGLMFALEIYNQLTSGDLTSGNKIAGTGTIDYEGEVGAIGGIAYKIVAADKAGAAYFLAPKAGANYEDAVIAVENLGSDMKVIPITTFNEAIEFLQSLH